MVPAKMPRPLHWRERVSKLRGDPSTENLRCMHPLLQVNYVNAHATSSLAGDLAEVKALKQVFKNPSQIKMNATKVVDRSCIYLRHDELTMICFCCNNLA